MDTILLILFLLFTFLALSYLIITVLMGRGIRNFLATIDWYEMIYILWWLLNGYVLWHQVSQHIKVSVPVVTG